MITATRLAAGFLFVAAAAMATGASATELKVLSDDAMKPALQELAKSFEASSKDKLKIDYATAADVEKKINAEDEYDVVIADKKTIEKFRVSAKIAAGSTTKPLAKKGADTSYEASMVNWSQKPLDAKALLDFLATPKAAEVYKAKGLQG